MGKQLPICDDTVPVHKTKHDYWNFTACIYSVDPFVASWPSRNVTFFYDKATSKIDIIADENLASPFFGECIFHCMRSFAVYLRKPGLGHFIHAAGVSVKGNAILFLGNANAGKTTLLIESILRQKAIPVCNDRIILRNSNEKILGHSWPSYVSMCEGTILNYPELTYAANQYDNGHPEYKTISWDSPLKFSFSKKDKRIYPQKWLTALISKKYLPNAEIRALVFPNLNAGVDYSFKEIDLANPSSKKWLAEKLVENSFDIEEPSFMPWHNIEFPIWGGHIDGLVYDLFRSQTKIFQIDIPLDKISESINELSNQL